MKSYKWTRGLYKSTISNVLECKPDTVEFIVNWKRRIVVCEIKCGSESATGVAICSCLDSFNPHKGKNIAAGRAVIALMSKQCSKFTRELWGTFPGTWTKKRINHLRNFGGMPKCIYGGSEVGKLANSHLNHMLALA